MGKAGKDNRGGARAGAGRPKAVKNHSDQLKRDVQKALKAKCKESGKSYGEVVVDMAYDSTVQDAVRLGAQKLIADILVTKETKTTIDDDRAERPIIYLPEVMEKPQEAIDKERE